MSDMRERVRWEDAAREAVDRAEMASRRMDEGEYEAAAQGAQVADAWASIARVLFEGGALKRDPSRTPPLPDP